jgi:hypothetical protein
LIEDKNELKDCDEKVYYKDFVLTKKLFSSFDENISLYHSLNENIHSFTLTSVKRCILFTKICNQTRSASY